MSNSHPTRNLEVKGAGLGLKRALLSPLSDSLPDQISFFEVAPENWIDIGGKYKKLFRKFAERRPFFAHGLSLSIGGPHALDIPYIKKIKAFLEEFDIQCYSEHLSYCSDGGHLYDLMPIPFTEEAVHYVANRIVQVQDILERPVAMENISYYAAPGQEMPEIEFINAVLQEADCNLLLDVNNIYVNSVNHQYNANDFLKALPPERVAYIHIAGHYKEAEDLLVDTHGASVIESVWKLLELAYEHAGIVPTLLERDFNIPPLADLLVEINRIVAIQQRVTSGSSNAISI